MGERGIDISEWQAGMDVERVVRENNISFVMVRTNYGSNHDDALFHAHCDGAERGGAIVTPYSYPLATDTRGSIDDAVRIIGGRYNRCIVDWEVGSGGGDQLRIAHERLWEHGLSTPITYDPAWYWQQAGSPNVDWMGQSGRIGGRWKSWYPDNTPGSFDAILAKIPGYVWNDSRGGIATRIVQFTSSGRLSGWNANLDLNYFPGSRAELTALLGAKEDDVPLTVEEKKEIAQLTVDLLLWGTPLNRQSDPDEGPIDVGPARLGWILQHLDARLNYIKAGVKLTQDDESKILAAVAAQQDKVDMSDEQVAHLIESLTDTTKAALKSALREGTGS